VGASYPVLAFNLFKQWLESTNREGAGLEKVLDWGRCWIGEGAGLGKALNVAPKIEAK